jgi:hypothetical protein
VTQQNFKKDRPLNIKEISEKYDISIPDIIWFGIQGSARLLVFMECIPPEDAFGKSFLDVEHETGWYQLMKEDLELIFSKIFMTDEFEVTYFFDDCGNKRSKLFVGFNSEYYQPIKTKIHLYDIHIPIEDVERLEENRAQTKGIMKNENSELPKNFIEALFIADREIEFLTANMNSYLNVDEKVIEAKKRYSERHFGYVCKEHIISAWWADTSNAKRTARQTVFQNVAQKHNIVITKTTLYKEFLALKKVNRLLL